MADNNFQLLVSSLTISFPSHKVFDLYVIAHMLPNPRPILSCCWVSHLTRMIIRLDNLLHNVIASTRNIIELYCRACRGQNSKLIRIEHILASSISSSIVHPLL